MRCQKGFRGKSSAAGMKVDCRDAGAVSQRQGAGAVSKSDDLDNCTHVG
jgi:hypothetical protein